MKDKTKEQIEQMKKVVIHIHLDGSLRPETVLEWLIEEREYKALEFNSLEELQNTDRSILFERVQKALMVEKNCRDLNEYLEKFDLPCKMLQSEEHIMQATFELFEDLAKQNVIYAEVRFAPSKHTQKGLKYEQIVKAAINGMEMAKSEFEMDGNLILCAMRGDDKKTNFETINVAKRYLGKGVAGVDLAGAESIFPTEDYKDIFKQAKNEKIPITIHAGEAAGPESIKKALEFGATRIGHGIRCLEDSRLVGELIQKEIVLEVCPTSNLQTKATGENHPIEELYRKGLLTTISPDNNTVSNTNINEEYEWILENTGLSIDDLTQMNINAVRGLFGITPQKKAKLISNINKAKEQKEIVRE